MELARDENAPMEQAGQLARLSDLDYEMEEGQPDIIGWAVVDEKGEELAKVEDLLVDLDTGAIMLAVISFADRQTLVPIDNFALDAPNSRLVLPVNRQELEESPAFTEQTEDVGEFFDYWGSGYSEEFEEEQGQMMS